MTFEPSHVSTSSMSPSPTSSRCDADHRRGGLLRRARVRSGTVEGPNRLTAHSPDRSGSSSTAELLQASDPLLAAQHLNYLILSVPINEAMFTGRDRALQPPTTPAIRRRSGSGSSWLVLYPRQPFP